jgi:hypothetical protein
MKWHTELIPEKLNYPISYKDKIMALGSCFVENIGQKLTDLKYKVQVNPFGIQYNPISIANSLNRLMAGNILESSELFNHEGLWHSFMHHSDYSNIDKEICLEQINREFEKARVHLQNAESLMITLGTAWVYEYSLNKMIVNNCHKLPASNFKRHRLEVDEIVCQLSNTFMELTKFNPNLRILITVSPIRHLKDGFHENQISKSSLLLAVEKLREIFKHVQYFPSYEIMMDDLRDYRFYKSDMVHPNEMAIDYIWEKFVISSLCEKEKEIRDAILKISQAYHHRIFNTETDLAQKFINNQLNYIILLKTKYDFLDFNRELNYFQKLKL